jgi:hypothetical protein
MAANIFHKPIANNNATAVKIYNATSSQVGFENKNILFCFEKTLLLTTALALWL